MIGMDIATMYFVLLQSTYGIQNENDSHLYVYPSQNTQLHHFELKIFEVPKTLTLFLNKEMPFFMMYLCIVCLWKP